MVFFLNYLYSVFCSFCSGRYYSNYKISNAALLFLYCPILTVWLLISGGQYFVGSDYPTYLDAFNGVGLEVFERKNEYLFVWIIDIFNYIGISGQFFFYFFYGINFLLLFFILKRIEYKFAYLFILLYFTVSTLYNNQLNVLRQSVAIYLCTYALILLLEKKKVKGYSLFIISIFIHSSSIFLMALSFFRKQVVKLTHKNMMVLLALSIVCGLMLKIEHLSLILPFLNDNLAWYISGGLIEENSLIVRISKYIFVPVYFLSLYNYNKFNLNNFEMSMYKWGVLAYCFRIGFINLTIINRVSYIFMLLSIYPIFFYFIYLCKSKKYVLYLLFILALSMLYFFKVVLLPKGEYLYDSIYFK